MRLLLDEHLAKSIAAELRARGIDAVAVTEDPSLVGLSDLELLRRGVAQKRALVTYDLRDLRTWINELVVLEEEHCGVVLVNAKRFPQHERYIGTLIDALDRLCREMPEENALVGREVWL